MTQRRGRYYPPINEEEGQSLTERVFHRDTTVEVKSPGKRPTLDNRWWSLPCLKEAGIEQTSGTVTVTRLLLAGNGRGESAGDYGGGWTQVDNHLRPILSPCAEAHPGSGRKGHGMRI